MIEKYIYFMTISIVYSNVLFSTMILEQEGGKRKKVGKAKLDGTVCYLQK